MIIPLLDGYQTKATNYEKMSSMKLHLSDGPHFTAAKGTWLPRLATRIRFKSSSTKNEKARPKDGPCFTAAKRT